MPHVVLNGIVTVDDIFNAWKGVFIRNESGILKTDNIYESRDKMTFLLEA